MLASPFGVFHLLILGRFVEALGCSVGLVVGTTMINDFYFPEQAKSRFAVLMIGIAVVPGIAVMIGGILSQYFNWQACLYFMLAYNIILFAVAFVLPETKQEKELDSLKPRVILKRYKQVLHNRPLLIFAGMVGCSASLVYIFSSLGPFIGIQNIGLSASIYGLIAMIPNTGLLLGGVVISIIVKKFSNTGLFLICFSIELIAALILLYLFIQHWINIYALIIPMWFIFIGHAGVTAIGMGAAASEVKDKANGTAMINFLIVACPVISTYIVSLLSMKGPIVLPAAYFVILIILGILIFFAKDEKF